MEQNGTSFNIPVEAHANDEVLLPAGSLFRQILFIDRLLRLTGLVVTVPNEERKEGRKKSKSRRNANVICYVCYFYPLNIVGEDERKTFSKRKEKRGDSQSAPGRNVLNAPL